MAAATAAQSAMLQSKDHGELLDVIDQLRSHGVDHLVPLPQIVVCGDQSSGKSSVLEAVSGVRFPTKDTLCTRFATELILRRSPVATVKVSIRPGNDRSNVEKRKLDEFKAPTNDTNDLPLLVDAAKEAMGINSELKAFSEDVLRVEVSGPTQPHLTLVDLPGLFHAPSKQQSAGDAKLVQSLVRSYMANERSIIVAVVSAKNDYANQVVTGLAREIDPRGLRTLGIITKPDTLIVGSDSERSFINLAKNEDVFFRLGWHCLVNRDFNTKAYSEAERNQQESNLFSKGVWTSLPPNTLGIAALKPRLSNVLKDQIISVLPSLLRDVQDGISDCEATLSRLGESRQSMHEQRLYLVRISRDFSSLIKAAIDGVYADGFFGDAITDLGYSKRVRAVVKNLLFDFSDDMRKHGQDQVIVEDEQAEDLTRDTHKISRSDYIDDVRELMRRSRGRELPGTFNPLIIGDLFFKQSRHWIDYVNDCSESVLSAVRTLVELTVAASADESTAEGLLQEILYPAMEKSSSLLQQKVAEIMLPHQQGHPITYNHYFTETIQKARQSHQKRQMAQQINTFFGLAPGVGPSQVKQYGAFNNGFNTGDLLEALTKSTEADMDRYACSEATDCMEAYYKRIKDEQVAIKVLVDNFSVLAVESCVLQNLPDILSPNTVMHIEDDLVVRIAAETEDSLAMRRQAAAKLETLRTGLEALNRLRRYNMKDLTQAATGDLIKPDQRSVASSVAGDANGEATLQEQESPIQAEEPRTFAGASSLEEKQDLETEILSVPEAAPDPEPDTWGFGNSGKKSKKKKGKPVWADD